MRTKILYVEDEELLGKIVKETLEKLGYEVRWEKDGAKVIPAFDNWLPDICVIDIMIPNVDGYTLCKTIRGKLPDLPVIFLTARTEVADLVKGFNSGGTDYIKKPFSLDELVARIENQLKITTGKTSISNREQQINIGKYILDQGRYELRMNEKIIKLSGRDMEVLKVLLSNRNGITSRKQLLLSVWGDDSYFNSRNLDVYIRKLRHYFIEDPSIEIITIKSNGYLFLADRDK